MQSKYAQLKAKRDAIESKMKKALLAERKAVIKEVRKLCKDYVYHSNQLKGVLSADGRTTRWKK